MHAGEVAGLQDLVPSYLSMDADGRVVRLDSWSKVLAPGLRLGWVTAHPDVLHLMALALHASLNGPPGISQVPWSVYDCGENRQEMDSNEIEKERKEITALPGVISREALRLVDSGFPHFTDESICQDCICCVSSCAASRHASVLHSKCIS